MITRSTVRFALAISFTIALAGTTLHAQKPSDGIKVHGHWTIDIRNADGTLASHNEFENACVECGRVIGVVLSRQAAVDLWQVQLIGAPPPCEYQGVPAGCTLAEPTLTLGTSGAALTIDGDFVATFDGQINFVQSGAILNNSAGSHVFSERTLATPIQVAAGQRVYVRVTFSFS